MLNKYNFNGAKDPRDSVDIVLLPSDKLDGWLHEEDLGKIYPRTEINSSSSNKSLRIFKNVDKENIV